MSHSKFEYVKSFEKEENCLPQCFMVIRVDGKHFHQFSKTHNFAKPNDVRAIRLLNFAAKRVVEEFDPIVLAYGQSDEFSFVFQRNAQIYERRVQKLVSLVASKFTGEYIMNWPKFFSAGEASSSSLPLQLQPDAVELLKTVPTFDARIVTYPSVKCVRDYLSWRQVDCHINNLYNTCFWKLVQIDGKSPSEAQNQLKNTFSRDKHELLFSRFSCNYNNEPEIFKKGTLLVREKFLSNDFKSEFCAKSEETISNEFQEKKDRDVIAQLHTDIIKDKFWIQNPLLLTDSDA